MYESSNATLKELHAEAARRRMMATSGPGMNEGILEEEPTKVGHEDMEEEGGDTHFTVQDVCLCTGHGAKGSCSSCSPHQDRVAQTSYSNYLQYCRAFQSVQALKALPPDGSEVLAGLDLRSLVAGEIHFPSFLTLLARALEGWHRRQDADQANQAVRARFLDLGSGLGRAVVAYALCFSDWRGNDQQEDGSGDSGAEAALSCGVEIRKKVHEIVETNLLPSLPSRLRERISLLCGDMFEVDCSKFDLFLVNGTGLSEQLFARLLEKLHNECLPGARIMSLSLPIKSPQFAELADSGAQFRMSWGNCRVFLYEKTR